MDIQSPIPVVPLVPQPVTVPEVPSAQFPSTEVVAPLPEQLLPDVVPMTPSTELPVVASVLPATSIPAAVPAQPIQPTGLPPLPVQQNLPPMDKQAVTPTSIGTGKKKTPKIVMLLVLLLVLALVGVGGVAAYSSLKTKFNPVVSPLVEGLLFTPGQQLTSRINLLLDLGAVGLASEAKDANIPVDTDFTEAELAYYKKNIGPKITGFGTNYDSSVTYESNSPISGVLGINSDAGTIDQSFINELMAAKSITVVTSGQEFVDISKSRELKLKGTIGVQLQLPSSQISTTLDSLIIKNQAYVSLKSFPENDYLDFSAIMNKWILFESGDISNTIKESSSQSEPTKLKRADVEKAKEILAVEELTSRIKAAPSETVNGVTSKCFSLALDTASTLEIAKAMAKKADELNPKESEISSDVDAAFTDTSTATTNSTICFAKGQVVPNKITSTSNVITETSQTMQTTTLTFSGLSKEISFAAPETDIIKEDEIPTEKMLKPAALSLIGSIGGDSASYRNSIRSRDVGYISTALTLYVSDNNFKATGLGAIPTCPKMAPIVLLAKGAIPVGSVNLYPLVTKEYLSGTLMDPSNTGTTKETGYTMCIIPSSVLPTFKVAAPKAEGGTIISQ